MGGGGGVKMYSFDFVEMRDKRITISVTLNISKLGKLLHQTAIHTHLKFILCNNYLHR